MFQSAARYVLSTPVREERVYLGQSTDLDLYYEQYGEQDGVHRFVTVVGPAQEISCRIEELTEDLLFTNHPAELRVALGRAYALDLVDYITVVDVFCSTN
jgi:hypothetical protein